MNKFRHRTAIRGDGARLDVAANGVWGGRFERAFFDVRVFNPSARSNSGPISSVNRKHEQEKKRQYQQRIRLVEHSTFTPLVFSTSGGMGSLASFFFKRLASMITEKKENASYSETLWCIRCKLNFALLRSSIMCVRGARSSYRRPFLMSSVEREIADARPTAE